MYLLLITKLCSLNLRMIMLLASTGRYHSGTERPPPNKIPRTVIGVCTCVCTCVCVCACVCVCVCMLVCVHYIEC